MVEIQFHPIAIEDIKELYDYFSKFSLQYADSFVEGLIFIEDLLSFLLNLHYLYQKRVNMSLSLDQY